MMIIHRKSIHQMKMMATSHHHHRQSPGKARMVCIYYNIATANTCIHRNNSNNYYILLVLLASCCYCCFVYLYLFFFLSCINFTWTSKFQINKLYQFDFIPILWMKKKTVCIFARIEKTIQLTQIESKLANAPQKKGEKQSVIAIQLMQNVSVCIGVWNFHLKIGKKKFVAIFLNTIKWLWHAAIPWETELTSFEQCQRWLNFTHTHLCWK